MSIDASSSNGNTKTVLRTALVGLKPADQVILKGYLRVLLRLETDFEWVSASHANVDLFFINDEFRDAESILNLLSTQQQKPVLFVTRVPKGKNTGGLHGDLLSLPIKQMDVLNNWLFESVVMLQPFRLGNVKKAMTKTNEQINSQTSILKSNSSRISGQNSTTHIKKDTGFNSNSKNIQDNTDTNNQIKNDGFFAQKTATTNDIITVSQKSDNSKNLTDSNAQQQAIRNKTANFHELIKTLKLKNIGSYNILEDDNIIATVNLDRNLIWPIANVYNATEHDIFNWKIVACSTIPQRTEDVQNLKQWLWQASATTNIKIADLVDQSQMFKLDYWVKPEKNERAQVLAIQTSIEKSAVTIRHIIESTAVDEISIQKYLGRLLFSGYLSQNNYTNIPTLSQNMQNNSNDSMPEETSVNQQPLNAVKRQATLDDVLSKRAAGEKSEMQTSSTISGTVLQREKDIDNSLPSTETAVTMPEKTGFLSRLRKKLGL